MRMMRWLYGQTMSDKITNKQQGGVAPIENNMRKTKLRGFKHDKMRALDAPMKMNKRYILTNARRQTF